MIMLAAAFFISTATFAQKISADKIPASVQKAFQSKFPNVSGVKWEMENKNSYEGAFSQNKKKMTATFDKDGKWMETETEIESAKLPPAVLQTISKQFAGYTIKESVQTATPDMALAYEADLKKGKEILEVKFSVGGEVLKKTVEKKGDENKD